MVFVALILNSCTNGLTQNGKTILSVSEFAKKMNELPTAPILDVRTPEEYSNGHLINALNYDWNGTEFEKQLATLDKAKPVFVYCLSGGRSSAAASKMRTSGFTQVYEMDGGIMKWRGANLPETTKNTAASNGMTTQAFEALLATDKLVLVDFYADWCAPCKKMKPYLAEISTEMADRVVVIRINADENQGLCKALKIDALPVLQLYKGNALVWVNEGFIEKAEVVKHIN